MQSCSLSEFNGLMETHPQEEFAINGDSEQDLYFTCNRFDLEINSRELSILVGIHWWTQRIRTINYRLV